MRTRMDLSEIRALAVWCGQTWNLPPVCETDIETNEGTIETVKGLIGKSIGNPLYRYTCASCNKHDWRDFPQKCGSMYLCRECTCTMRSFIRLENTLTH